ncbi:KPN_01571 family protein [Citrobacter amalonaticus]
MNTHRKMNPIIWVVFALLAVDAVRELMGLTSISGMW